jgi:hypothetical protein
LLHEACAGINKKTGFTRNAAITGLFWMPKMLFLSADDIEFHQETRVGFSANYK